MDRGHRQIDHTADLALAFWAPTEEALLDEGARALILVLTGGAVPERVTTRTVSLTSIDPEDRLVQWLNQVLVLATLEGFVTESAELRLRGDGLDAVLHGDPDGARLVETELKSVTYHDVRLTRRPGRVAAQVVVDV